MLDSPRRVLTLAAVLTAVFAATAWQTGGIGGGDLPLDLALLAANTLPLLALGRQPLLAVLAFSVAYPLWLETGHQAHLFQSLPTLAALYAVGAWSRPAPSGTDPAAPVPLWLRAVGLVAPAWMMLAAGLGWWRDADLLELGYVAMMFVLVWALGVVLAARRSYAARLEARTAALEAARRELAERAVADERARIARELHDVIAHAMSVITVRAGVGAHLIDSRPAQAAEALRVIERTGREALSEMRRMLTVLRDPDPLDSRADAGRPGLPESSPGPRPEPQPGLADLPRLVDQVAQAGTEVTVTTEGTARPLPPGLDLAAYRVVQEALTNVVKHAPGARASVTVRHLPERLEVEIRNPTRAGSEPVVPGQGLRGMGERVALYDGRLRAGPDGGAFLVSARFPVAEREP